MKFENLWDADNDSVMTQVIDLETLSSSPVDFSELQEKKVLLLVHGYNNTAEDALTTYQKIHEETSPLVDPLGAPLYDVIIGGKALGMQFMDEAIWNRLRDGYISPMEAYMKAIDKKRFQAFLPPDEAAVAVAGGGDANK